MNPPVLSFDEELDRALNKRDLQTFVSLINHHKVDVNSWSFHGMPALHFFCSSRVGYKEIFQWLLEQPQTDLEKNCPHGCRAIHNAVIGHNLVILEMLIKKGAQLDCRILDTDVPWTPLYLAARLQHSECSRLLIQHGCNVNLQNGSLEETPLQRAILSRVVPDVIKLLVDKLMEEQVDHPEKLIDVKRGDGRTALLLACQKKNCAAIELLVEAGADTLAADKERNTALILVASNTDEDQIPKKELTPHLFELYQRKINKKLFENHPILLILAYLIKKGCCWQATNNAGKRASDILLEKGHPQCIIGLLDRTAATRKRVPIGANGCMGLNGECSLLAVYFRPSCSHHPSFNACSECFSLISEQHKCGCPEEGITSIKATQRPQDPTDLVVHSVKQEAAAAAPPDEARNHPEPEDVQSQPDYYLFEWISGPDMGFVVDHVGNKYTSNGQTRKDGSVGYRCCHKMMGAYKKERCPAVARRFFNTPDGVPLILLQEPHNHRSGMKRSFDGGTKSGGDNPRPSCAKRSCADGAI